MGTSEEEVRMGENRRTVTFQSNPCSLRSPSSLCSPQAHLSDDARNDSKGKTPSPTTSSTYVPLADRDIDQSHLKFKIKKYDRMALPPYHHPNEFKVILEVKVEDLKLSQKGIEALIDIVGPRYIANKKLLKLTCNKFDTRVENRNYLLWLLDSLLQEAESFHADV